MMADQQKIVAQSVADPATPIAVPAANAAATSTGNAGGRPNANTAVNSKDSDQALAGINRDFEEKAAAQQAKDINLPYVDVAAFPINPDILHVLPIEDAKRANIMPFFKTGKTLRVAVFDLNDPATKEVLAMLEAKGYTIQVHLASRTGVNDALRAYASDQYKLKSEVKNVVKEDEIRYEKELENLTVIKDKLAAMPAEEGLNLLHVSAIKAGASDIHYQPEEAKCIVRFRIDGVLHTVFEISRDLYSSLINQLKYKAGMKLNITNIPQDGRFRFIVNDRKIDVRVGGLPTEFGEAFVCRILDSGKHFDSFEQLGFSGRSLEILDRAQKLTQGMILVTGPTSSGKTTSLYVLLTKFNTPDVKIITLEDPVEYNLPGITQSQINEKRGYTFADGLKSILRQDPDIVMIGEIRDLDTAQVCSQAALTGHVVLTTLHTNGAVETIPRLVTIGMSPATIAPALSAVMAQRLIRRLCESCAAKRPINEQEKKVFEDLIKRISEVGDGKVVSVPLKLPETVGAGKGCEQCNFTGFRGQMVVSEVLEVTDEIRAIILAGKPAADIFAVARKNGMITMGEDGILKVMEGKTTLDEVQRVVTI